ncbi:MAG: ferric reductase-like transmembrane domain-containing protein [Syntrophotalea sp.]|uniref:ferredoxin reductase family protein n=1 Tax=Syntrophotalea sp. TaxID=2812029 RepID=UPI003D1045A5
MLTTSRSHQNLGPVIFSLVLTMALWLGSKWYFNEGFDNFYKYPAKAASLLATVLMCWCIVLSARMAFFEDYFGGLDKVYQVHKRLGKAAFFLILAHPLFLALDRMPDVPAFLRRLWFLAPGGDRYLAGHNLGVASLLLMAGLLAVTLWIRIPYHRWKRSHEWFGLVLLAVMAHVIVVDRDIARYPLLGLWMYALLGLAALAYLYIRFFYARYGPRYAYCVDDIEKHGDILQITFAPEGQRMDFKPSQFIYLVVHKQGIAAEPHPYSIACGYNRDSRFKLGIKQVGDHTRSLDRLEENDAVSVYGPYGRFSDRFLAADRDCVFIGGGIGITPFLGMWHVALHSEERLSLDEAGEKLMEMHPECIRNWKSPLVSLFYVCITEDQACFDNDIKHEVIQSHFHGFKAFEERGHYYELYLADRQGLITAEYIDSRVREGVRDKNIFLCGPTPMVSALVAQFKTLGVSEEHIILEDFNLF